MSIIRRFSVVLFSFVTASDNYLKSVNGNNGIAHPNSVYTPFTTVYTASNASIRDQSFPAIINLTAGLKFCLKILKNDNSYCRCREESDI